MNTTPARSRPATAPAALVAPVAPVAPADAPARAAGLTTAALTTALTAAALGAMLMLPAAATAQDGIAIGERPEAPTLETVDGQAVDLSEIFGTRPALVEFWATWCTVCQALEPTIRAAHETYGDDVEFLVVAVGVAQTLDQVRQHMARRPMPGTILWDARGAAARAFRAPGTGFIVILDGDGKVAYTGTSSDQDLVGALRRVVDGTGG